MDLNNVRSYLGIDLAGYVANRTAVVELVIEDERAIFKILRAHPFNSYRPEGCFLTQIRAEADFLNHVYHNWRSHIVIDAPIDLNQMSVDMWPVLRNKSSDPRTFNSKVYNPQLSDSLLNEKNLKHSWQLQKRPIDKALGGMPPTHSNLGIVTKRVELALARSWASESYPKISKRLIGYKTCPSFDSKIFELKHFLLNNKIDLETTVMFVTNDELDAMFCALAGLLDSDTVATTHEEAIKNPEYLRLTKNQAVDWPIGYRLLINWPKSIKSVLVCEEEYI